MGPQQGCCGTEQLSSSSSICAGRWSRLSRATACGVSKNMQQRSQADKDSWNGLFDTQAGPGAGVSRLSNKRADTVGELKSAEIYVPHMPS